MPIWTKERPPYYKPDAVSTNKGWEDPDTGEVLIAIGELSTTAGNANVVSTKFSLSSYQEAVDLVEVTVQFNERVDVTAGATITVNAANAGPLVLTALAQLNTSKVLFTGAAAPATPDDLTVPAQSISGTIVDAGTAIASDLTISASAAAAAGNPQVTA